MKYITASLSFLYLGTLFFAHAEKRNIRGLVTSLPETTTEVGSESNIDNNQEHKIDFHIKIPNIAQAINDEQTSTTDTQTEQHAIHNEPSTRKLGSVNIILNNESYIVQTNLCLITL
jgi:hypothetical protein